MSSTMVASLILKGDAKGLVAASAQAKAALGGVSKSANDVAGSARDVVAANGNMASSTRGLSREQDSLRAAFAASRAETRRTATDGVAAMGALTRAATGASVAHTGAARAASGASAANTNLAATSKAAAFAMGLAGGAVGGLIAAINPLELLVLGVGLAYKAYSDEMDVAGRKQRAQAEMVATLSPLLATYKSETDKAADATGLLAMRHRDAAAAAREQMQATLDAARMDVSRARAAVQAAKAEAEARLDPANMTANAEMGTGVLVAADMARASAAERRTAVAEAALKKAEDELIAAGVGSRMPRRGFSLNRPVVSRPDLTDRDDDRPRGPSRPTPVARGSTPRAAATGAAPARARADATGRAAAAPKGPSASEVAAAQALKDLEDKRNTAIAQRNQLIADATTKVAEESAQTYLSTEANARLLLITQMMAPLRAEGLNFSQEFLEAELDRTIAIVDAAEAETARLKAIKDSTDAATKRAANEKTLNDARAAATGRLTDLRAEEANQAGKTRAELEVMALVEGEINRLKEIGVPLTEGQIEAERARLKVLAEGVVTARKANELADKATQRMERAAEEVEDAWLNAWDRMLDGSLDGFEDFGKSLVKLWKSQILRQIMQRIQVPVDVTTSGATGGAGSLFGGSGQAGEGGWATVLQSIFGRTGGSGGGFIEGLESIFTKGAESFTKSAGSVGTSFEKLAVSFGAKAGGKLAGLANFGGQAFAGYSAGSTIADAVGLKGNSQQTYQAIGDTIFATAGMALGGPIGSAIGTIISRAIGTFTNDKDYAYARSDVVVRNGQFGVSNTDVHDGGDGAGVSEAAGALALALNEAAKLFKLDLSKEEGAYSSFGYTTGRFGIGAGFFGGAVNTASGVYDQTSDALGTGRKGRSNLEAVGTQYGQVVMNEADAAIAATEIVKDTIIRMAERAGQAYSAAEIAVIRSAASIEEAAAKITRGREFSQSLTDMIQEITDPALAARRKAIKAVEDQITALRSEANDLIGAGLASGDVLKQLDELRELKLAKTLEDLGDAAAGAVGVFAAARPRLQQWLDGVRISDTAQLSPGEARQKAYAQYERALEKARAGDADALGNLTQYADALLSADRAATEDAQARLRLFNSVTGAVEALAGQGSVTTPDLLRDLIIVTREGLEKVTDAIVEQPPPPENLTPVPIDGGEAGRVIADAIGGRLDRFGWPEIDGGPPTRRITDGLDGFFGRLTWPVVDVPPIAVDPILFPDIPDWNWDPYPDWDWGPLPSLDVNAPILTVDGATPGRVMADAIGGRLGSFDWPQITLPPWNEVTVPDIFVDMPDWTWPALPALELPDLPRLQVDIGAQAGGDFSRQIIDAITLAANYQVNELRPLLTETVSGLGQINLGIDDLGREQAGTNSYLRASEAYL
jgi:hypothetical protein